MPDIKYYTFAENDSIYEIAYCEKVPVDNLILWNHLEAPEYMIDPGNQLIISDPNDVDPENKKLERDIHSIEEMACNDLDSVSFNGSDVACDATTQSCSEEPAPSPPEPDCKFSSFSLEKIRTDGNRPLLVHSNTPDSGTSSGYYLEIVTGYGSNPSKVKLKLNGVKTNNCPSNHPNNVIYAKVDKRYEPTSDSEYTYEICHSYWKVPSFSMPRNRKITHEWIVNTCDKSSHFKIGAYPDDKFSFSFSMTPFKKDVSRTYQQQMEPVKYTYINPAIGNDTVEEGHILKYTGTPEEIYNSTTDNPFIFHCALEFDGGSEKVEFQLQAYVGKNKKVEIKTVKSPIPDSVGKWAAYEEKIKEIKEKAKKYLEIKRKIKTLLDEGFCGKGKTTSINWGIHCTFGFKAAINIKEIECSNYCGTNIAGGFFMDAGASRTIDFANRALSMVPVIGPGLLALNIGLSELEMGGLFLRIKFSAGIKVDLQAECFRSFETNKWMLERIGGEFDAHFVKVRLELGLGIEYKNKIGVWRVSVEVQAVLKGEVWGETGLYGRGQAYYQNPNVQSNPEDATVDLGYLACEAQALYAVKLGADITGQDAENQALVDEDDNGTTTTTTNNTSSSVSLFDHQGQSEKWVLWKEGSFFGDPVKIKDLL